MTPNRGHDSIAAMSVIHEVRRRARHAALPLLCALAIGYFGYHAVQGERGLVAWLRYSHEIAQTKAELVAARGERLGIERRVGLLKVDGLDRDLLDERARVVLGLAHADEVVFLDQ